MSEGSKLKYPAILFICFPFLLLATTSLILAGLGSRLGGGEAQLGSRLGGGEAQWEALWKVIWLIGGLVFTILLYTKVKVFKSLAHTKENLGSNVYIAWLIPLLTWPAEVFFMHKFIYDTLGWNTWPGWYMPPSFILGMFVAILGGWWVFKKT